MASRAGAGSRFGAFVLDIVFAGILVVVATTATATLGGVRLGLQYQELLGGRIAVSDVLDGSVEQYVETRVETAIGRLETRIGEDLSPEAIDRMGEIMAEEMLGLFEPRWSSMRFYLRVDEDTLPTAIDEAFDAVIAREDPQLPAPQVNALREEVQSMVSDLRLDEFLPSVVSYAVLIAAIPFGMLVLYFLIEALAGASFGKMAVGLVIGTARGDRAFMGTTIYRFFAKFAGPVLVLLGFVLRSYPLIPIGGIVTAVMLIGTVGVLDENKRCLHDYLAGTAVYRRGDLSA